jgi:hypothetical protein
MDRQEYEAAARRAVLAGIPLTGQEEIDLVLVMSAQFRNHPKVASCWTETTPAGRAWFARGINGHPWLIASSDLDRFKAAIDAL